MKAARLIKVGKPFEIQDIPKPELREDDERDDIQTIVRVKACGICGTDIHQLKGTAKIRNLPITLGHEISGVVEEVGRTVSSGRLKMRSYKKGDRVVVNNVISCGECRPCLRGRFNFCRNSLMFGRDVDGGLAEFVKVPARNLVRLPVNVTFAEGAVMGCAVVTAYHALTLGGIETGTSLVVWGAGGVGLSLINLARELSAAYPIIAVDRRRSCLKMAEEMGADFTVNASKDDPIAEIKRITHDEGTDLSYDTAGITDVESNGELKTLAGTATGGQLIVIATYGKAVHVEPHDELGIFEKKFTGSCGNLPHELEYLTELTGSRKRLNLMKLITNIINLEDINDIIERWQKGEELIIRPVVTF